MKKIPFLILVLVLTACSASPEVTVTSPPPTAIPTPTLHPGFLALQTHIAGAGEGFALLPDGTVSVKSGEASEQVVPGLTVSTEGKIFLETDDGSQEVESWNQDSEIHFTPGLETLWIQTEEGLFVFDSDTTEWDRVDDLAEGSGIYESGGKQFVLMGDQLMWVESVSESDGETHVVTKDGQTLVWQDGEWVVASGVPEYLQNLQFVQKVETRADLLDVSIEDVHSGAFAEAIKQAYLEGRIPPIPDDTAQFVPVAIEPSEDDLGFGRGSAFSGAWGDAYATTGVFVVTDENGEELFLSFPKIIKTGPERADVEVLLHSYLWDESLTSTDAGLRDVVKRIIFAPDYMETYPAKFYSERGCRSYVGDCTGYVRGDYIHIESLIDQWVATGIFPSELSNYPVLPRYKKVNP